MTDDRRRRRGRHSRGQIVESVEGPLRIQHAGSAAPICRDRIRTVCADRERPRGVGQQGLDGVRLQGGHAGEQQRRHTRDMWGRHAGAYLSDEEIAPSTRTLRAVTGRGEHEPVERSRRTLVALRRTVERGDRTAAAARCADRRTRADIGIAGVVALDGMRGHRDHALAVGRRADADLAVVAGGDDDHGTGGACGIDRVLTAGRA